MLHTALGVIATKSKGVEDVDNGERKRKNMARLNIKRWLRLTLYICLGCVLFLLLSNCSPNPSTNNGNDVAGTTLTVATEPAFPPFEFQAEGGLQGFDIDLMQAIALAANFKVNFQSLPFDGIIPALQAGTVGAAISSITITEERANAVDFSRPYFKAGLALAVRSNNQDITSFNDLKNRAIAVQIGTTGADEAKKVPGVKISSFDSAPLALQELANGNVDAVINDAPVTLYAIKNANLQGIKVVGQQLTEEYYGIATPNNSPNLQAINQGLSTILTNGTYDKIYQKWFSAKPPELPEKLPFQN